MARLEHLPSHVLALALHSASVLDLFRVAHTSRALHALLTGRAKCTCAFVDPFAHLGDASHAHAFWAHWRCGPRRGRHVHEEPGLLPLLNEGSLACLHYAAHMGVALGELEGDYFQHAVREDYQAIVWRLLREPTIDPSSPSQMPLWSACAYEHVVMVNMLLRDPRVDPGTMTIGTPLWVACAEGNERIVSRLLSDPRVDPSVNMWEAWRAACRDRRLRVLDVMWRDGRVAAETPLRLGIDEALSNEHDDVVRQLQAHFDRLIADRSEPFVRGPFYTDAFFGT